MGQPVFCSGNARGHHDFFCKPFTRLNLSGRCRRTESQNPLLDKTIHNPVSQSVVWPHHDEIHSAAALREATEESGIVGLVLDPDPVDLDIHSFECPKGVPNRHLDVRFRVVAPVDAVASCSDESLAVDWFDVGALPRELDASTLRLIARAVARG